MHTRNAQKPDTTVTHETFYSIFMSDTGRTIHDAPECPLIVGGTCDCSSKLREYAIAALSGHPCGEGGEARSSKPS